MFGFGKLVSVLIVVSHPTFADIFQHHLHNRFNVFLAMLKSIAVREKKKKKHLGFWQASPQLASLLREYALICLKKSTSININWNRWNSINFNWDLWIPQVLEAQTDGNPMRCDDFNWNLWIPGVLEAGGLAGRFCQPSPICSVGLCRSPILAGLEAPNA